MDGPVRDAPTTRRISVDGYEVACLVAGDGPPVVHLHGGGWDSAALSWRETVPALAAEYTVYAPDLPGYGESDPPTETPTTAYYGDVVLAVLDALGVDTAALVGVSLGSASHSTSRSHTPSASHGSCSSTATVSAAKSPVARSVHCSSDSRGYREPSSGRSLDIGG